MINSKSFTVTSTGGVLNVLTTPCTISEAFDHTSSFPPAQNAQFSAVWDTGATNSAISQNAVDQLGLKPIGMTQVQGVGGTHVQEVYLVAMLLPNGVGYSSVRVTKANLGPTTDVLIGMDIIGSGDFSVTNKGGVTKFSFRHPSVAHIDFVEDHNRLLMKTQMAHGANGKARPKKPPKQFGRKKK